jgi:hypothetical protein
VDPEPYTFQEELVHYEVVNACIKLSLVTESRLAGMSDIVQGDFAAHINALWNTLVIFELVLHGVLDAHIDLRT